MARRRATVGLSNYEERRVAVAGRLACKSPNAPSSQRSQRIDVEGGVANVLAKLTWSLQVQYFETGSPTKNPWGLAFLYCRCLLLTVLGPAALLRVCDALSGFRTEFALSHWLGGLLTGCGPKLASTERGSNLRNLLFDSPSLHLKPFERSGKERCIL
jgi:hypothetical protein